MSLSRIGRLGDRWISMAARALQPASRLPALPAFTPRCARSPLPACPPRRPNMWHLAKGGSWGGDLYADCLAKRFGGRWLAETHMKTAEDNKLPSTAAVANVTRIVFPDGKDYGSKGDHAKVRHSLSLQGYLGICG